MIRAWCLAVAGASACLAGCIPAPHRAATAAASSPVDVHLQSDEADRALAIVRLRASGVAPSTADWERLFTSQGYQHLKEREHSMGRAFTDSSFAAFLTSDTVVRRFGALARGLDALERVDVRASARAAAAYLPPGTPLRARLYLEIKPQPNSFVFTGRDSIPSIFLYVDPARSPAQLENTMAHELHHIGLSAACPDPPFAHATPAQRALLRFLGAFGEGQAMLAAAGGPDVHPHAADPDTIKARWDRDVASAPRDIAELSSFFESVLDGRVTSRDSVVRRASSYFGVQGPWYTVGWLMASTVERELGRAALIGSLCEPTRFLALYQAAARRADEGGATLPIWNEQLIADLEALRQRSE